MLDFLPTGTNLTLKSPEGPVLDGITVEHRRAYKGIRFSVAAAEGRPARSDITKEHLLGYYLKYVMGCRATAAFWSNPHDHLFVKDGPYKGLTLKEVEVAGPERDLSKPFPLAWIPQGASFHIKYPGDAPPSEPCNFFMTEVQGPGFMPAGNPTLWSAEKLVASYCERFGLPNVRDPYSLIIWRQGEFKGLSLRACKALLDAERQKTVVPLPGEEEEEPWMKFCRENCDRDVRFNAAWARAQATVELERKALAEELAEREAKAAPPPVAPAKPSVAEAKALIEAKEAALRRELASLEDLKAAQERVKALVARIAGLKSELNIQ